MICDCEYEKKCDCAEKYDGCSREDMLMQIKAYDFSLTDLTLYCDTHPEDTKAIYMHNQYAKAKKDLSDKYQKVYGPLTSDFPCNKWRWIEQPWGALWLEANYLPIEAIWTSLYN